MKRLFDDTEFDKISMELLNKVYPIEALQSYYKFGVAQTLSTLTDIANQYINGKCNAELDAYDLKKLIIELMHGEKEIKEYYERLRKEGIKTEFERLQEMS
jgi:hypothetical protein